MCNITHTQKKILLKFISKIMILVRDFKAFYIIFLLNTHNNSILNENIKCTVK